LKVQKYIYKHEYNNDEKFNVSQAITLRTRGMVTTD